MAAQVLLLQSNCLSMQTLAKCATLFCLSTSLVFGDTAGITSSGAGELRQFTERLERFPGAKVVWFVTRKENCLAAVTYRDAFFLCVLARGTEFNSDGIESLREWTLSTVEGTPITGPAWHPNDPQLSFEEEQSLEDGNTRRRVLYLGTRINLSSEKLKVEKVTFPKARFSILVQGAHLVVGYTDFSPDSQHP